MINFPNAKINIGLHIIEKRSDGFHNIETVFYPVGLCDILEITENSGLGKRICEIKTTGIPVSADPYDNLVVKAYNILNQQDGLPGISVYLHKIIPMGAGLGGGSSDAAFMLNGLNTFFNLGYSNGELEEMAAEIGSDCPFFINNKPVFAYERGDKFKDINLFLKGYYLVIAWPGIHVGTPEAYGSVTPSVPGNSLTELINTPLSEWKGLVINDFEKSVFRKYPEIETVKDTMYKMGAIYASMSGSGSAVYGLFEEIPEDITPIGRYFNWCGRL